MASSIVCVCSTVYVLRERLESSEREWDGEGRDGRDRERDRKKEREREISEPKNEEKCHHQN